MKPLQIGLLVAAGALGGAFVMKWQSSRQPKPVAEVMNIAPDANTPATPVQSVAPAESVPEPPARELPAGDQPSPFPERNKPEHRKTQRSTPPAHPAPAVIAQNDMRQPQPAAPPAQPAPQPAAPAPAVSAPAEPPVQSAPSVAPAREQAPPPVPAPPNRVTIPAGTTIPVRLVDGLSSERNMPGDTFVATLDAPLVAGGFAIAERGARVEGKVVESAKAGKVSGVSSLVIALTRVSLSDGQKIAIQTQSFTKKGDTSHGTDAAKVGGGAALGAIIGAIAGGGKGAGVGAGVGGAAGAGDVLLTRGKPATLPSETRINFRLADAVTVTEKR